jgi:hypothetical protein
VPSRICGFCLNASFGASAANEAINHSCNVNLAARRGIIIFNIKEFSK